MKVSKNSELSSNIPYNITDELTDKVSSIMDAPLLIKANLNKKSRQSLNGSGLNHFYPLKLQSVIKEGISVNKIVCEKKTTNLISWSINSFFSRYPSTLLKITILIKRGKVLYNKATLSSFCV